MPKSERLGDAVWAGMRDEYVTGNESYSQIAIRYNTTKSNVEKHALNRGAGGGRTWGEWRVDFRRRTSEQVEHETAKSASRSLAAVKEKAANVANLALDELKRRLTKSEDNPDAPILVETKDLVQAAKLATSIKIELGGDPDGAPIELIEKTLDQLSVDDLRKIAAGSSGA